MTNQELNEQRARWAGFTRTTDRYYYELGKRCPVWVCPDGIISYGSWHMKGRLFNFPVDIRACLDYIGPKLLEKGYGYNMRGLKGEECYVELFKLDEEEVWDEPVAVAYDQNLATAFCLAVDQVIKLEEATHDTNL